MTNYFKYVLIKCYFQNSKVQLSLDDILTESLTETNSFLKFTAFKSNVEVAQNVLFLGTLSQSELKDPQINVGFLDIVLFD